MSVKEITLTLASDVVAHLEREANELNTDISVAAEMVLREGFFCQDKSYVLYRRWRGQVEMGRGSVSKRCKGR